jgi:hypothetical protein
MGAEKWRKQETLPRSATADCANARAEMRILWDLPLLAQGCQVLLEERAQDRLQAQRAWILRCSTSNR